MGNPIKYYHTTTWMNIWWIKKTSNINKFNYNACTNVPSTQKTVLIKPKTENNLPHETEEQREGVRGKSHIKWEIYAQWKCAPICGHNTNKKWNWILCICTYFESAFIFSHQRNKNLNK